MSTDTNDQHRKPTGDRSRVFRDLRQRNERRLEAAQILEDRRRTQMEHILEAARDTRLRGPRA